TVTNWTQNSRRSTTRLGAPSFGARRIVRRGCWSSLRGGRISGCPAGCRTCSAGRLRLAGPINAGTFGPGHIDLAFGPEIKFLGVPEGMKQNRSPFDGWQFYGIGRIDGDTRVLTMSLHDIEGKRLYAVDLDPEA